MAKVNDFVFCIFSFNRSAYLKNLINSIIVFYPDMQVVIFDDNSDEEELFKLYGKLDSNPAYSIVEPGIQHQTSTHGGLYDLMNMALQYCWKNNFNYAFFIQDDMQFQRFGCVAVNEAQELQKLIIAMALVTAMQNRTVGNIEGSEQRGCAVTNVVMCHPLNVSESHRQYWLSAL